MVDFERYITSNGEIILYTGNPDLKKLDELSLEEGDVWHSGQDQGFSDSFPELIYQTAVYWWFLNAIEGQKKAVCWRINIDAFAIRKSIWDQIVGELGNYDSKFMVGLDLGYNLLRNYGAITLYVKGLYDEGNFKTSISKIDRYRFYFRNFKFHHAFYMLIRKGIVSLISELFAFRKAKAKTEKRNDFVLKPRDLKDIKGLPSVSLIIPTMRRQKYAQILLEDHKTQSYPIKEAIIVDATPEGERDPKYYRKADFPFNVKVKWQTTKGSCRARNEAMDMCTGDYIIFADDDIRILPDFVENHIRLLQTYNADACNGLDIMAENENQDLTDLKKRLFDLGEDRWRVGVSPNFSNANSCVKRDVVNELVGNDINFDGGYGEDSDFGLRILQKGYTLLHNPFSANLHLKPPQGGYRWWGKEAKKRGRQRKVQPWELDNPVKYIRPVPSPTITYGVLKHFSSKQVKEWRKKHFFIFLFKKDRWKFPIKLLQLPYKQLQFSKSLEYGKALIKLGVRYK